jgi:hypothetical protein
LDRARHGLAAGCLALAGLALTTGCGREDIRVYEAPKDRPEPVEAAAATPGMGERPASAAPQVTWKLPAGWQERPAGTMRVGYFVIAGPDDQQAEVTIIPLTGTGGGDLDNVNRWRAQVGLGTVTAEELSKLAVQVPIGPFEGRMYDLSGEGYEAKRVRTLAAILRHAGTAWFFKMTGNAQLVGDQKGAFTEFLRTLSFGSPGAALPATAATPPSQGAAPATASPAAAAPAASPGGAGKPGFTAPAHWQEQAPGSMQVARFVPQGEGQAEVSVAMLPGDGGGTLANVNRWRRQLGLAPISEAELAKTVESRKIGDADGYWVDIQAPDSGRRMAAAAVLRGAQSWFYKLTGDTASVEREKPAFVQFVESATYAP